MQKLFRRLFFYSSRQLYRRRRAYLSIFLTSVVLLTLVMTFLEMMEAYSLRDIELTKNGYHHAVFLEQYYDRSEDFLTDSRVRTAISVPYSSRMASSDDTSKPAKIVVYNKEIAEYLDVNYIWGSPPEDGEIAIPANVYRSYGYLIAGEVNDLYFTASQMSYYPLRISGIFEYNNHDAGYAFVTENTAAAIDAETGAVEKFDTYITCKSFSDRYAAKVVEDFVNEYRIGSTDEQSRRGSEPSNIKNREKIWADYINREYLKTVIAQGATPVVLMSMPIILIAALMMASFMSNWTMRNCAEYGILGAIGADRKHLCAIAAGQILLISMAASVPVILFSAVISNVYIQVYNLSVTDVGFVFRIPWGNLIQAALWFDVFSCLFTYIGISRLTLQAPFVLISGSYRSELPFIQISSQKLETSRHKVFHISLLRSLREIRMQILPAVITSLVCIVCGAFVVIQVVLSMQSSGQLEVYGQYSYDAGVKKALWVDNLRESAPFDRDAIEMLESFDMVDPGGIYTDISMKREHHDSGYTGYGAFLFLEEADVPEIVKQPEFRNIEYGDGYPFYTVICDSAVLPLLYTDIWEGSPGDILTTSNSMVVIADMPPTGDSGIHAGDTILLTGQHEFSNYTKTSKLPEEPIEFTVAAVVSGSDRYREVAATRGGMILMSEESAVNLGLMKEGEYEQYFFNFKEGTTMEEQLAFYEVLRNTPKFLRYDLELYSLETESVRRVRIVNTALLFLFFFMVFFSLCTMTFVDATLRIEKTKNELAVLRQVGAKDRDIYRTTRTYSIVTAVLALALTTVLFLIVYYGGIGKMNAEISRQISEYSPSEETIARWRERVQVTKMILLCVYAASLPMHLLAYLSSVLGTVPPTRRALKETITDGIRKDTD